MAWEQAKATAAPAPNPKAERVARIERQIAMLPYRSTRYDIGAMRRDLDRQIAALAT